MQAQDKTLLSFVQSVGLENKIGRNAEVPGKVLKTFLSGSEATCYGCEDVSHFQNNCNCVKALLDKGVIIHNQEGQVCLPDRMRVPNIQPKAYLVDRIEKYYATMKPLQMYYGTFEEIEERFLPRSSYVNKEVEEHEQRIVKLEKEFELNERLAALKTKQSKLEESMLEKADVWSLLLHCFDEELLTLQNKKPGFL
jgi:hypothetical protein